MAGEAASELDNLRAACDEAVRRLGVPVIDVSDVRPWGDDAPERLVVVGGDKRTHAFGAGAYGSLSQFGLPWTYGDWGGDEGEGEEMPLSLTLGEWLMGRRREGGVMGVHSQHQAVAFDASPEECLALGRELAGVADRVAMLVMGDGTACRTQKAPGYLDERAEPYDAAVARALGNADAAALADLAPGLSQELQVAGRAAWQVLAGAAGEDPFRAELLADEAPYGVGYLVASWARLA